jgi:uncharacterized membrane protein YqiK
MKRQFIIIPALALSLTMLHTITHAQNKKLEVQSYTKKYDGKTTINATEDGKKFEIDMEGSKIVSMYVDGTKIREEDFSKYESTIKKINERIEKEQVKAEAARAEAEKHREAASKHREEAAVARAQAEVQRKEAEVHRKEAEVQRQQAERTREEASQQRLVAEKHRKEAEQHRAEAEVHRKEAEKHRAEAEVHRAEAAEQRKRLDAMVEELVTDKLISSREELRSLNIDNTELLINGVKQPDAVFKKYKNKYFQNSSGKFSFRNDGNSRTISLD